MTAGKLELDPRNFLRVLYTVYDPVSKFRVNMGRNLGYGEKLAPGVVGEESHVLFHDSGLDPAKLTYTDAETGLEYPACSPMFRKVSMTGVTYRQEGQCLTVSPTEYPNPIQGFPDDLRRADLAHLVDEADRVLMHFYQGIAILAEKLARVVGLRATCIVLSAKQLRLFPEMAAGATLRADGSATVCRREI